MNNNADDIHRIDETAKDNFLRITAQEKVTAINEQRLQSIEKEIDEKAQQLSYADI